MTLNDLERCNSLYFAFFHRIRQIFRPIISQTYNVCKILFPSPRVLLLAKTITHPAARSLCDSWASCFTFKQISWKISGDGCENVTLSACMCWPTGVGAFTSHSTHNRPITADLWRSQPACRPAHSLAPCGHTAYIHSWSHCVTLLLPMHTVGRSDLGSWAESELSWRLTGSVSHSQNAALVDSRFIWCKLSRAERARACTLQINRPRRRRRKTACHARSLRRRWTDGSFSASQRFISVASVLWHDNRTLHSTTTASTPCGHCAQLDSTTQSE